MILSKKVVLTALTVAGLALGAILWRVTSSSCPDSNWFNFDVTCRVLDVRSDNTDLIEYFDPDTNELRLYLRHDEKYRQIEHPYGKVKNFKLAIRDNEIKFNPRDDRTVLVNGEIFPITSK